MKQLKAMTLIVFVAIILTACGIESLPAGEPEITTPPQEEAMPAKEVPAGAKIEIDFWHAMGGSLGEAVDDLVQRFNDSQNEVLVKATFQGSYDDNYNALLAAFETDTAPNIIQNFEPATQTMIDTGRVLPVWQLMEADGYDPDIFIPAVRDYYSDETGLVSMSFNSSTVIVYYNADLFDAAGLEPPDREWTFSEFLETCQTLQAADVPFCVSFATSGWYFEQFLANGGDLYFDENNGRTGRATAVQFDEELGVEVFSFLTGLIEEGYAPNVGPSNVESASPFFGEQAAMLFLTTAGVQIIETNASFEVGTTFIPHADSSEWNGVVVGGAALWLIETDDPDVNAAAWEFMKFLAELDQQKAWHMNTGYYPIRLDVLDDPELQEFWQENPNFQTAVDELSSTKTTMADGSPNYAVLGGRAGPFPAIRRLIVEAYSRVLDDDLTPEAALSEATQKANEELANYNAFFE
jgi:sn-glycerol 3-phosphate transport system substrate-binding protein